MLETNELNDHPKYSMNTFDKISYSVDPRFSVLISIIVYICIFYAIKTLIESISPIYIIIFAISIIIVLMSNTYYLSLSINRLWTSKAISMLYADLSKITPIHPLSVIHDNMYHTILKPKISPIFGYGISFIPEMAIYILSIGLIIYFQPLEIIFYIFYIIIFIVILSLMLLLKISNNYVIQLKSSVIVFIYTIKSKILNSVKYIFTYLYLNKIIIQISKPYMSRGEKYSLFITIRSKIYPNKISINLKCDDLSRNIKMNKIITDVVPVYSENVFNIAYDNINDLLTSNHESYITIPNNMPCSFKSANNATFWYISVHMYFKYIQRVELKYPLIVTPSNVREEMLWTQSVK